MAVQESKGKSNYLLAGVIISVALAIAGFFYYRFFRLKT